MVEIYIPEKNQRAYAQVKKTEHKFALMLVSRIIFIQAFRHAIKFSRLKIFLKNYFTLFLTMPKSI